MSNEFNCGWQNYSQDSDINLLFFTELLCCSLLPLLSFLLRMGLRQIMVSFSVLKGQQKDLHLWFPISQEQKKKKKGVESYTYPLAKQSMAGAFCSWEGLVVTYGFHPVEAMSINHWLSIKNGLTMQSRKASGVNIISIFQRLHSLYILVYCVYRTSVYCELVHRVQIVKICWQYCPDNIPVFHQNFYRLVKLNVVWTSSGVSANFLVNEDFFWQVLFSIQFHTTLMVMGSIIREPSWKRPEIHNTIHVAGTIALYLFLGKIN